MPSADAARLCVWCRRHEVDPVWRPFCSERCKLQDLARWADGTYRLAGDAVSGEENGDDDDESKKAKGKRQK